MKIFCEILNQRLWYILTDFYFVDVIDVEETTYNTIIFFRIIFILFPMYYLYDLQKINIQFWK